jgi:hypothetical protein
MAHYNLLPEQTEYYLNTLSENPYRWAGECITRIDEIVEEGSHEPDLGENVYPDRQAETNRKFLQNQILLFEDLGLPVPSDFQEAIDKATSFLKETAQ